MNIHLGLRLSLETFHSVNVSTVKWWCPVSPVLNGEPVHPRTKYDWYFPCNNSSDIPLMHDMKYKLVKSC